MYGLMIQEHGRERTRMPKNLWDKEYERVLEEIYRDYLDEGYDKVEARTLARTDAKEIMKDQLDFVEELYDNTLNNLD
jgi:hypothetical protein